MRVTRDIEDAVLPRRWSFAELVTLTLFLIWCLALLGSVLLLLFGIGVAISAAWRQWLDVALWAAISFVSLIFLAWIFYRICRLVEWAGRPK